MENQVLITFEDNGKTFQLFKTEMDGEVVYTISSDAVDVSSWGGGCFWCVEFEKLSDATFALHQIIENIEKNGKVDTTWLVETFGKGTC